MLTMNEDDLEALTRRIIGCAIEVHTVLGRGLLESIYKECLRMELERARLPFEVESPLTVTYKGAILSQRFRVDLLVDRLVVVEVKSMQSILPVHSAQVLSYLRLTGCPAGLLINFNDVSVSAGLKRLSHPDLYNRKFGAPAPERE
jgi:GxxExxY protein